MEVTQPISSLTIKSCKAVVLVLVPCEGMLNRQRLKHLGCVRGWRDMTDVGRVGGGRHE